MQTGPDPPRYPNGVEIAFLGDALTAGVGLCVLWLVIVAALGIADAGRRIVGAGVAYVRTKMTTVVHRG